MARTGRPPIPNEVKRRRGTARADRTPHESSVVALPMAAGVPDPPIDLQLEGRQLWARIWSEGLTWISPRSDWDQAEEACRTKDDLAIARERYRATREPADARALNTLSKQLTESLSALGFNPSARTRLGVAEVKRQNALEELISRRQAGQ